MIKAIQTKYKGYHFRSRLEARWAVYFDAMKIKWGYETEGFQMNNGTRYLPDFWFPLSKIWGDVKPDDYIFLDPGANAKMKSFVVEAKTSIVILEGVPRCKDYRILGSYKDVPIFDTQVIIADYKDNGFYYGGYNECVGMFHEDIADACEKATSKRFEFEDREE